MVALMAADSEADRAYLARMMETPLKTDLRVMLCRE